VLPSEARQIDERRVVKLSNAIVNQYYIYLLPIPTLRTPVIIDPRSAKGKVKNKKRKK